MKINSKIRFLSAALSAILLASCSNFVDAPDDSSSNQNSSGSKSITVTGTLNVKGAVPSEVAAALYDSENQSAKAAGISIRQASYYYYVHAEKGGVAITPDIQAATEDGVTTFELNLTEYGSWTLYAYATTTEGDTSTTIFKSDNYTASITEDTSILKTDFTLKPVNSGNGNVRLDMTFPSSVTSITTNSDKITVPAESFNSVGSTKSASLYANSIPSGSYTIQINFLDTNSNLLYSTTQEINVFAGFDTTVWINNGGDGLITNSSFTLTDTLVSAFAMTNFFVDGSYSGNDSTGTWVKPLKTVCEAVNKFSDSTKDYTIYLMGDTEETRAIGIYSDKSKSVTIKSYSGQHKIKSGSGYDSSIILNFKTLTLENITIDGTDHSTSGNGGGISNSGTLTLTDCKVQSCTATGDGGGIYSSGTLYLYGSTEISSNQAKNGGGISITNDNTVTNCTIGKTGSSDTVSIYGNTATQYGGALNGTANARYIMNSGSISSNSATSKGGAIYLWGDSYHYGTFTLKKGSISSNSAANGGAVCIDDGSGNRASFIMTGGTVSGNTATGSGKAIYNQAGGQIKLSGNAYINSNNDIYISSGNTVTIEGDLSPTNDGTASGTAQTYTATITPKSPVASQQVLSAETNDLMTSNIDRFYLNSENFYISQSTTTGILLAMVTVGNCNDLQTALTSGTCSRISVKENITVTAGLTINNNVTVQSLSADDIKTLSGSSSICMFTTSGSAELTLKNITLKDSKSALDIASDTTCNLQTGTTISTNGSDTPVHVEGTLNMEDGASIKNNGNKATATTDNLKDVSAGAILVENGTFNMKGGEISGNRTGDIICTALACGAITIINGTMNMYGGKIYDNYSSQGAAAIRVGCHSDESGYYGGIFNMYGGEIFHHYITSTNSAAGQIIALKAWKSGDTTVRAIFNMYGGKIYENHSASGIVALMYFSTMNMKGGEITNNHSSREEYAGGIVFINPLNTTYNNQIFDGTGATNAKVTGNQYGGTMDKSGTTWTISGGTAMDIYTNSTKTDNYTFTKGNVTFGTISSRISQ